MSDAYTPKLRDALLKIGKRLVGESMKEGVYCMVVHKGNYRAILFIYLFIR